MQELLAKLWSNEKDTLTLMFGSQSPSMGDQSVTHDMFFLKVIAVPPCRFRPPAVFGDQQFDHPQNSYLAEILRLSQLIVELQKSGAREDDFGKLVQSWLSLQEQVNYLCDSAGLQRASVAKYLQRASSSSWRRRRDYLGST